MAADGRFQHRTHLRRAALLRPQPGKSTSGGSMAGGPMLLLWNEWATQILVLLSFTLQIFLFVFARTRRHGSSAVLRILLWLVYLMADSTAVYTLGHLSINGSPHKDE
ncbi:hypothetical protein QYE76_060037 [Lolium multiflorum]|uniref:DUF4220 domain-containing protein n=1 Tax=Lolium multiflorum TaxID=4521 RepID=A0AAD8RYB0_LOLMU|nr:hypothetical protein QYE76_060037 [Lolium multiflorum]